MTDIAGNRIVENDNQLSGKQKIFMAMAVVSVFLLALVVPILQIYANGDDPFRPYYRDSAPDGWYHQREGIGPYNYVNGSVSFALCDHSYLGPLHGTFKVSNSLQIMGFFEGNTSKLYDLRIENNIIVDARTR